MTVTRHYRDALRALLTPAERRTLERLNSPQKIQSFLDGLPVNFCLTAWETMSPRRVLKARIAHCAEGALLSAAAFAYHGQPALIMDLRATPHDDDHVVALFRERELWGAISKTNHSILRWRDPIYRTPRELAMSYAHEYCMDSGEKSLVAFSRPFLLTRYAPEVWVTSSDNLDWLMDALDDAPHEPVAPRPALRSRRRASAIERSVLKLVEWPEPKRRATASRP
ncbi:MAG TPA: hypothetical protein VFB45_17470 [Pseudolabrys sp.]|nr:hypothetical protein [Pseudolabrys sp.]